VDAVWTTERQIWRAANGNSRWLRGPEWSAWVDCRSTRRGLRTCLQGESRPIRRSGPGTGRAEAALRSLLDAYSLNAPRAIRAAAFASERGACRRRALVARPLDRRHRRLSTVKRLGRQRSRRVRHAADSQSPRDRTIEHHRWCPGRKSSEAHHARQWHRTRSRPCVQLPQRRTLPS